MVQLFLEKKTTKRDLFDVEQSDDRIQYLVNLQNKFICSQSL